MEIILDEKKPRLSHVLHKKKAKHGTKELKEELHRVMRHHGIPVKHSKEGIDMMDGAGIFDSIKDVVKKGADFYHHNKDMIHKGIEMVAKHAPTVYKAVTGHGKSGGAKSAGSKPHRKPSAWIEKLKKYQKETGCSYKEAMIHCAKRK